MGLPEFDPVRLTIEGGEGLEVMNRDDRDDDNDDDGQTKPPLHSMQWSLVARHALTLRTLSLIV